LMIQLHLLYKQPLPDIPLYSIGYTPSFDVAGINVDIGAELGLVLRSFLDVSITGTIETGLDASWNYQILHQHGVIYSEQISNSSIQRTQWDMHPTSVEVEGEAVFRFGPALVADLSLELFSVGVKGDADLWLFNELEVSFAYPAYEALSSTTTPSTLLGVYGICHCPHYLQYQWNIGCNATLETLFVTDVARYSYPLFNEAMLFGCAVAASESSPSSPANFTMTIASINTDNVATLTSMLQDEFAQFEASNSSNFLITGQAAANSFMVSVLDGDTTLASNLCANIVNTGSSLYNATYTAMNSMINQVSATC